MLKRLLIGAVVIGTMIGCSSPASDVGADSATKAYQSQDEKAKALEKQNGEVRRDRGG
jgi:peptidoglycan hydrolase CwlO-like protein